MRSRAIAIVLLAAAWMGHTLWAQQTPSAVVVDSLADAKFPPGLAGITIPSHGADMDATFYLASGAGPHGTVLLLHGLPGYESNVDLDLAQSIRRAGWNVLLFHYRGTWGTAGHFYSHRRLRTRQRRPISYAIRLTRRSIGATRSDWWSLVTA